MIATAPLTEPAYKAPALGLLMQEGGAFAYMRIAATFGGAVPLSARGSGHKVIVFPGFMASDQSTGRLRRSLNAAGFDSHGWGLGRNRGVTADMLARVHDKIGSLAGVGPISLIGWSLGGLVAREYAKLYPENVRKVVTLGSPFSGDPRANNAWRAYEAIAGHSVDNPPIQTVLHEKPPVPTIAFWSPGDGIVAPEAACGLPGQSDHQIRLDCRHMDFVSKPAAIQAIAAALAE
ncbi:esterase/lipase family protein [Sphingorhabdus arenilitoris]|uniref:Esterase/lipase family protein n=1 Tax=Sphingorhabdus arenilitoris TaxID=1490041 RepID=A0ABV8RJ95_9SPHN